MGVYKLSNSSVKTGRTIYGSMLAGNSSWTDPDTGAMFPLQVITVGPAGASEINFTNIPSTYSHLQVRSIVRDTGSSYGYNVSLRFNADSGSNYTRHNLEGNGSSASASGSSSAETSIPIAIATGGTNTSGNFAGFVCDILDYANTNKNKTVRCLAGYDDNGSGYINLRSGAYLQTTAISSIRFIATGTAFAGNSQFALYAVKAAS